MKKLLSVVLALAIIASCFTMITIVAGDTAAKTVVNGDAESTGGWQNGHLGGTTTIIEEPGNTTNHVAKVEIKGQYQTIGYDLTPAIVQNADKNLAGGGAGIYNFSFRYKTADPEKTGTFQVHLTSKVHMQKVNVTAVLGADAHAEDAFYQMNPGKITMTGEWQTYEGTFAVTQQYLDMLKACEAAGKAGATDLTLRLDGSGVFKTAADYFDYYLDDLTIEKQPEPKGIKFEITEDFDATNAYAYYRINTSTLSKDMAVDGKITKTFVVHNTSDVALKLEAMYQNGWTSTNVNGLFASNEIPAGESKEFTLTVPCDANGTIDGTVAITALNLRFNLYPANGATLKAGNAVVVEIGNHKELSLILSGTRQNGTTGKTVVTPVTTLPTAKPVVVGYEIKKTTDNTTNYIMHSSNGGAFTAADIKDGKLTKTYTVYNTNDYEVSVEFCLQATLPKADGNGAAWVGRGVSVKIPAKSSAEVTTYLDESTTTPGKIHFAANAGNGTAEQDVDVTKIFERFNIKKADANAIVQDLAIIVAADEKDVVSKLEVKNGFTVTPVTELPVVATPSATAAPTATPTAAPVVKGMQFVGVQKLLSETGQSAKYPTCSLGLFTAEDVVWTDGSTGDGTAYTKRTGTVTRSYNIYNNGEVAIKAGVTLYAGNRLASGTSAVVGWDVPTGTTGHATHQQEAIAPQSAKAQTITFTVYELQDGTIVVADKKSKMTIGEEEVVGYAPIDTARLRVDFWDFDIDASMIIAPAEVNANDEIYTLQDTSAYATKALVYELPDFAVVTPTPQVTATPEVTATPVVTPTPVANKEVVNGDAENGKTGWTYMNATSVSIVADPDDANNHVAMLNPGTNQYATVAFKLGAAILQDAANGYNGGGAGKYTITFRAKAEEGKGGRFNGVINSQLHRNKDQAANGYTCTENTYATGSTITMTDAWATYSFTVNITESWLQNIYNCYAADPANASVYNLLFRLDGSNGTRAFANGPFTYYVDDITIEKQAEEPTATPVATPTATPVATPTATPAATPATYVGTKYEVTEAVSNGYPYSRKGNLGLTAADVVDGAITLTYDVYNTGNVELPIKIFFQGGSNGWKNMPHLSSGNVTLAPQTKATVTVSIAVNADNTVNVAGEDPCTLDKLALRVDISNTAIELPVGASFIIVGDYVLDITSTTIQQSGSGGDKTGKVTVTKVTELPDYADATPTPVPTATPVPTNAPAKEVVNGNAEDGNTGWGVIHGGTTTIIADPDNAENNIVKFAATGAYHSVAFDLAPAILQDAANGYNGGGAGKYNITFRAKAEEGKGGAFTGMINSIFHKDKNAVANGYTCTESTYMSGTGFAMTDEWATYTVTVSLSEAWLQNIYNCYAASPANASVYKLVLRLDGSGSSRAFKDGAFTYYIDDVTVEKVIEVTPTPTPNIDPVGLEVITTDHVAGTRYLTSANGVHAADDTFTGKKTVTYTVYNASDKPLYFEFMYQVEHKTSTGSATWATAGKGTITTILPHNKAEFTAELTVENGLVTVTNGGVTTQYPLNKFFYRITFAFEGAEGAGDMFVVATDDKNDPIYKFTKGTKVSVSKAFELPEVIIATPTPITIKEVVNGDVENGKTAWGTMSSGKLTVIEEANGNHYMEYDPAKEKSPYSSVNFDLGPAISQYAAMGYEGGGAGQYMVTFRVKAEAGKGGAFSFVLNSAVHKNKNDKVGDYTLIDNTYMTGAGFTMTDEWQTISIKLDVKDAWLQNIYKVYEADPVKNAKAFTLNLRFDGSGKDRAFGNSTFKYYVDDVQIKMLAPATPEPIPVGMKFETKELYTGEHYVTTSGGVLAADPTFTGKKTISYTFYNTSKDQNAYIYFGFQVTHKKADGNNTWADAGKGQAMTILPERKVTLTAEVDVNNGIVTVTNGGTTAQYTLDKLFARFNFKFPGATGAGNSVVVAGNNENDILYNVKSGYKLAVEKVGVLPDYIEASKADTAPKKENGNAEKGLANWGTIHGGKVELVQPGAAGTGNAVRFTPTSATGKYNSIAFDLGPWIIYDKAEGYLGGGAGKYEVTFYAKGDKAGKFNVMLNSQLHIDQKAVAKEIGSSAAVGSTWLGGTGIEMTKSWKKYTVTIDVTADWYKQMLRLYDSNHAKASMAYQLALRFDGVSGAFKNGAFSYVVDQVTVKKVASYSLAAVTGVELELKEDTTGATYLKTGAGVLSASMINKDDQIVKEFLVENTGTETIKIYFTAQAAVTVNGKASWVAPNSGETFEIEPGDKVTISYTMDVNKDKTITVGDEDVALDKFFYRFDLKNEEGGNDLYAGTKFKIIALDKADYKAIAKLTSSKSSAWVINPVYEKSSKSETGDVLPVAMIATVVVATAVLAVVAKKKKED